MNVGVLLIIAHLVLCDRLMMRENEELKRNCGAYTLNQRNSYKSFGGRNVAPNEFPWLAKIFTRRGDNYVLCAGVQISSRHIMTAAHCVMTYDEELNSMQCLYRKERRRFQRNFLPVQNFSIYVGTRCNFPESCMPRHEAVKLWAHEQWDECDLSHDIALIELKNNVPILESSPVCLPEENTKIAQLLHSAGSGMDSTITSGNKYARGMQVVNLRRKSENKTLAMITTRGQSSAMCGGDSGGPLFQFNTRGQYTAVGVVSGALVECGEENFNNENFFADVRQHLAWICSRTGVCPISVRTNAPSIVNTAPVVQSYSQNARPSNTFFTWNQGSNSANNFNQQSNWFYLNDQTKRVMYLNQQSNGIYSNMWSNPNYFNQRSYPGYNHLY